MQVAKSQPRQVRRQTQLHVMHIGLQAQALDVTGANVDLRAHETLAALHLQRQLRVRLQAAHVNARQVHLQLA